MSLLNSIKEGCGVGVIIMIDGKPELFKLAVFTKKSFFKEDYHYEYKFINESRTKCFDHIYSGGNTGLGCDYIDDVEKMKADGHEFLTDDLDCIKEIANREEEREENERKERIKKTEEKVAAINNLPKEIDSIPELPDVKFARSNASFDPAMSSRIMGGHYALETKNKSVRFFSSAYKTKDGKWQVKKFAGDIAWKFGDEVARNNDPKTLLEKIAAREEEIKNMVKNA